MRQTNWAEVPALGAWGACAKDEVVERASFRSA